MKPIFRHLIALGVFLAAGTASYLLWQQEKHQTELGRLVQVDSRLREITSSVEQRMLAYEQVLRAVQGQLSLPGHSNGNVFHLFVESLQLGADFAGLDGIGIAMRVPADRVAGHVAEQRKKGFAGYAIKHELVSPASATNAPKREVLTPIVQMEPFVGRNQRLLGRDLHADPVLRVAMEAARDSGRAAISAKVQLASEGDVSTQVGFMMFLPLYADGPLPQSVADRRAGIIGWVVAPVRMEELMASLYGDRANAGDIRIYDGVQLTNESMMFSSSNANAAGGGDDLLGWATEYQVMAGRTWVLAIRSQNGVGVPFGKEVSDIIAVAGLTLSLLLAILTWVLLTGRSRMLATATRMTTELREAKDHFELVFNVSPDSVLIARQDNGEILNVNDGFTAMTGYRRDEAIGKPIGALHLWDNEAEQRRYLAELFQNGSCDNMEAVFRTSAGASFVGIMSARTASFRGARCFVGVIRDISERKAAELRITHMAQHDPLTGLPNRALFADRLQSAVLQAKRDQTRLALMYLDLDKFKPVNDTLGHAIGDMLLRAVASRMLDCVRQSDTVGRIGGDEFIVLLANVKDKQDVLQLAEKVRLALNQPFVLDGVHRVSVSTSVGIAFYPEHGTDEMQLQHNADIAVYTAKALGRNRIEFYVSSEHPHGK